MTKSRKPRPAVAEVADWLRDHHGSQIAAFTPLEGGYWSSAYAYRVNGDELVLRVGDSDDGYRIDQSAAEFARPALPVPEVLEIGRNDFGFFAISRRHHGRFIETAPASEAEAIGTAMAKLLAALRAVPSQPGESATWHAPAGAPGVTWHQWLLTGLLDAPDATTAGWREKLARQPRMDALFRTCESRIHELLPACPERRDLVHSDLLHQNVLVAEGAPSRVTAVFSWKCSARGDFLYDVAWNTIWSPWHPAIAEADIWQRTLAAPDLSDADLRDAGRRHHCYELQIAASHFGWYAWTGEDQQQAALAEVTEGILERGPLGRA